MQRQLGVEERFIILIAYRFSEDEEDLRTIRNLTFERAREEATKAVELMARARARRRAIWI